MRLFKFCMGLLMCIAFASEVSAQVPAPAIFQTDSFAQFRFAHRGGYAYGPENAMYTISTNLHFFDVNAIEVDIRMTSDKELVLFHDETVERILEFDTPQKVTEFTEAEITSIPYRDHSIGEIFVPTFSEFMDSVFAIAFRDKKEFVVELDFKPTGDDLEPALDALMKEVEKQEQKYGDAIYRYFYIGTFYPDVLKGVRARSEKIVTAFAVSSSPDESKLLARIAIWLSPILVRKHKASGIEPLMCMVNKRYVRRWRRRGCFINAWTANTACQKEYLRQFPVAFTTNCPLQACEPDPSDQIPTNKKWCKNCK